VADGAARQAAWALAGGPEPPPWAQGGTETFEADPAPEVRERYAASRDLVREAARDNGPAGTGP
jgi:xylulokinase